MKCTLPANRPDPGNHENGFLSSACVERGSEPRQVGMSFHAFGFPELGEQGSATRTSGDGNVPGFQSKAAVAEQEAEAISKRTKAALAAAKARGTKLGGRRVSAEQFREIGAAERQLKSQKASQSRAELLPTITAIQAAGASSLRAIAAELNAREIPTPRRMGEWSTVQVQRVMGR